MWPTLCDASLWTCALHLLHRILVNLTYQTNNIGSGAVVSSSTLSPMESTSTRAPSTDITTDNFIPLFSIQRMEVADWSLPSKDGAAEQEEGGHYLLTSLSQALMMTGFAEHFFDATLEQNTVLRQEICAATLLRLALSNLFSSLFSRSATEGSPSTWIFPSQTNVCVRKLRPRMRWTTLMAHLILNQAVLDVTLGVQNQQPTLTPSLPTYALNLKEINLIHRHLTYLADLIPDEQQPQQIGPAFRPQPDEDFKAKRARIDKQETFSYKPQTTTTTPTSSGPQRPHDLELPVHITSTPYNNRPVDDASLANEIEIDVTSENTQLPPGCHHVCDEWQTKGNYLIRFVGIMFLVILRLILLPVNAPSRWSTLAKPEAPSMATPVTMTDGTPRTGNS